MRSLPPDASEGPRAELLDCVARVPGTHLRGLERMSGLPLGQVLYHLDRLERMGLIVSVRDQGFRRYYVASAVGRAEKKFLAALRHEVPRRIVIHLLENPRLTHKDLQGLLGVAGSTLSFHLQRLLATDVLVRERDGATNRYVVSDPALVRRELIYYRESFHDELVDRFVRRALEGLPPSARVVEPVAHVALTPTEPAAPLSS